MRSIRLAFRTLRRRGSVSVAVIGLTGVAVGLSTVVFSLLEAVVFTAAPYPNVEQLFAVRCASTQTQGACSLGIVHALRQDIPAIDEVGYSAYGPVYLQFGRQEPLVTPTKLVSSSLLSVLGMRPQVGRWFLEADNAQNRDLVVLSDRIWEHLCARCDSIVGTAVRLDGRSYEVVGVMPRDFAYPDSRTGAWVLDRLTLNRLENLNSFISDVVVRTAGPTSTAKLNQTLALIASRQTTTPHLTMSATPLRASLLGPDARVIWILFAATIGLLVIVTFNIANLLVLQRIDTHIAALIRMAIGASPRRLLLDDIVLYLLMSAGAGVVAVMVANVALTTFQRMGAFNLSRADLAYIGLPAYLFACGLASATVMGGALSAMVVVSWTAPRAALGGGGACRVNVVTRRRVTVIHRLATAVQLCLAVGFTALAASGGLLLQRIMDLRLGFEPRGLFALSLDSFRHAPGPVEGAQPLTLQALQSYLFTIPGVQDVATSSHAPLAGARILPAVWAVTASRERIEVPAPRMQIVSDNYFRLVGIPMVAGRPFDRADAAGTPCTAVVNRSVADVFGGPTAAINGQLALETPLVPPGHCAVVGVAENARDHRLKTEPGPEIYLSSQQVFEPRPTLLIRTRSRGDSGEALRAALSSYTATHIDTTVSSVAEFVYRGTLRDRLLSYVALCFGIASCLVALLGVIGVVSNRLSTKEREIGIRLALGSSLARATTASVSDCMWAGGAGLILGLYVEGAIGRLFSTWAHELAPVGQSWNIAFAALWCVVVVSSAVLLAQIQIKRHSIIDLIRVSS